MSSSVVDSLVGTTLGSFRIVRVIGRGGMGTVYLGEHAVIGSRVAIKVLLERLASDEGLVARFYAEARAVNMIGHENIVNIFDMNVVPPHRYYLVMEYLEGRPLNALMTAPVPAEVSIPILVQVCEALQAAHNAAVIHRDLKPENIFLVKRGRNDRFVKVLDFGLAKLLDSERDNQHTAAGLIVGTPEFMSPEQANSTPVDGRADIYALGCIAWLLATAKLPFPQRGLTDLLVAHRQLMPEPPHVVVPSVPRAWSDVIMKAMSKRPQDRFQTAAEFARALEESLPPNKDGSVRVSPAPLGPPPPPSFDFAPLDGELIVAEEDRPPPLPPPAPRATSGIAPPPAIPPVGGKSSSGPGPQKRHLATFEAIISTLDGKLLGTLQCQDISKGGMFLQSENVHPSVFTRVKVTIPSAENLGLLAEVVRHVPPDQAKAWGMAPGFGVQFLELTPALRESIAKLIQTLPVAPKIDKPVAPAVAPVHSPQVEAALAKFRDRVKADHYGMIGAAADADFPEIRAKAEATRLEIEKASTAATNDAERAQFDAALKRVQAALDTLGKTKARALYDAHRGNYLGVSRCLAAGISALDLDRIRALHLSTNQSLAGSAHVKLLASKALEAKGQWKDALDACESALQMDSLNVLLHQRRETLLKKVREAKK